MTSKEVERCTGTITTPIEGDETADRQLFISSELSDHHSEHSDQEIAETTDYEVTVKKTKLGTEEYDILTDKE